MIPVTIRVRFLRFAIPVIIPCLEVMPRISFISMPVAFYNIFTIFPLNATIFMKSCQTIIVRRACHLMEVWNGITKFIIALNFLADTAGTIRLRERCIQREMSFGRSIRITLHLGVRTGPIS
jgi:hypothetical protein